MANSKQRKDENLSRDYDRPDGDRDHDTNPDAITGAPGSHPIGTGIGAAGGGVAGAAIGAAVTGPAAPIGAVVGAVIGAVAGGLAGKGAAEAVNPTDEDAYWRDAYMTRPYFQEDYTYDDYRPAYEYGWSSRQKHQGKTFDDVETDLGREWDQTRGQSKLTWDHAKHATRDAWDRVTNWFTDDEDRYWRENYQSRPYYSSGATYDEYRPAYEYGTTSAYRYRGRDWNDVEPSLRSDWETRHGSTWERFKDAVRDAWDRATSGWGSDRDETGRSADWNQGSNADRGQTLTGGMAGTVSTASGTLGTGRTSDQWRSDDARTSAGSSTSFPGQSGSSIGSSGVGVTGGTSGVESTWSEELDQTFRRDFAARPYAHEGNYDDYRPAYEFGTSSRSRYHGRDWNAVESDLRRDWESRHGSTWDRFKDAVRDAWHRVERALPGDADRDRR